MLFIGGVLVINLKVLRPERGAPQRGVISPLLTNVYLHYALDLWFDKLFQRSFRGAAFIHRYADDFVCGFQREEAAQRFYSELEERCRSLDWNWQRTKRELFRSVAIVRERQALSFSASSIAVCRPQGRARLKRRTARKKLRYSLNRVAEWCQQNRHRCI